MQKRRFFLTGFALILGIGQAVDLRAQSAPEGEDSRGPGRTTEPAAPPAIRPWTVLLYGAADNNADGPILQFLHSIRKAIDDDPGLELLFLVDRHEKYSRDARILGEDFTGTRLYRVKRERCERLAGGPQFPEITLDRDVELDTADADNLRKFIAWGKATAPARRYMLLIYSHASGASMCPDEQSRHDMGIAELSDKLGPPESVDVIALELCNMAGIEVAYQWRPGPDRFGAPILVAIPNAGPPLDWHRAFKRIRTPGHESTATEPLIDPGVMTAEDFGRLVVEEGHRGRLAATNGGAEPSSESAGCFDLTAVAAVKEAVDTLSGALAKAVEPSISGGGYGAPAASVRKLFFQVRRQAMSYCGECPFVDLYDLCRRLGEAPKLPKEVREAARAAAEAVDRFVLASFGMSAYEGFDGGKHGVFIVAGLDEPGRWKNLAWYDPRLGAGSGAALAADGRGSGAADKPEHYGRWAFLADGAEFGNGRIDNWFELLDAWCDEDDPAGGLNAIRP